MIRSAAIAGTGVSVPAKIITNDDLSRMVETSDEWIMTRTGIKERRVVEDGQAASDLGFEASASALKSAGMSAGDIDLIIAATMTPDKLCPSTACIIQEKLGAGKAAAVDIGAACSGFVYGLSLGRGAIVSGEARNVLLVATEALSRFIDWSDRASCVLFGDAAGAVVLKPSYNGHGVLATMLGADGGGKNLIEIPAGGSREPASRETVEGKRHFLRLSGQEVFKVGVRTMVQALEDVLRKAGVSKDDLALLVPHQANRRILDSVADGIGLPAEKLFLNLEKYGNTSAASVPVALHEARAQGRIKPGDLVATVSFGAGLTWGASVIRW